METILSIIAIVLSVISGGFSLYSFVWTARRDRKQATLDAYNQLQEQTFDKLNTYAPAVIRRSQIIQNPKNTKLSAAISPGSSISAWV